ncbi:hypothetical protein PIROE2DRAFT_41958, partial [Piromyces sp. E2]
MHLSLLSQGRFSLKHIDEYDYNYYYPSSAGQDVDIIIMDSGFNFNSTEFSNTKDRTTLCTAFIKNGETTEITDGNCKTKNDSTNYHGECVSDAAAGLDRGVANKANIFGLQLDVTLTSVKDIDILAGLRYISDHLIRPNRTVINLSFENLITANKTIINISSGKFYSISDMGDSGRHYQLLIRKLVESGAIVIACAGNQGALAYNEKHDFQYLPCSFDDVICVGGIDNINPLYQPDYILYEHSNSGTTVDIYAPFFVYTSYQNADGEEISEELDYGTSFSTPLVSGVAALIMAEQ